MMFFHGGLVCEELEADGVAIPYERERCCPAFDFGFAQRRYAVRSFAFSLARAFLQLFDLFLFAAFALSSTVWSLSVPHAPSLWNSFARYTFIVVLVTCFAICRRGFDVGATGGATLAVELVGGTDRIFIAGMCSIAEESKPMINLQLRAKTDKCKCSHGMPRLSVQHKPNQNNANTIYILFFECNLTQGMSRLRTNPESERCHQSST